MVPPGLRARGATSTSVRRRNASASETKSSGGASGTSGCPTQTAQRPHGSMPGSSSAPRKNAIRHVSDAM